MTRGAVAALVVVLVATVAAGCASPEGEAAATDPDVPFAGSADPGRTEGSSRQGASRTPSPAPLPSGHGIQPRGAVGEVPDEVIQRQLRDAAERIAKRMLESPSPEPTPVNVSPGTNRALGYQLLLDFGFAAEQWQYLDQLWIRESGWNHLAENRSSGAYGIPQSLPGDKMAAVGPDWRTNPETQIKWGLAYIAARYGTPEKAWAHSERVGWD
jgi:hypothetical protein